MNTKTLFLFGLVAALPLAACGKSNPLIGGRSAPDETTVVAGPALSVPPDFTLRPPRNSEDPREDLLRRNPNIAPEKGAYVVDNWLLQNAAKQANTAGDSRIRKELTPKTPEEIAAEKEAAKSDAQWWDIWDNKTDKDDIPTPAEEAIPAK